MRSPSRSSFEKDQLSSPDPLASSPSLALGSSKDYRQTMSSTTRNRKAAQGSIETRSISLQSSPSKTITEQTLSPWKIRVTVEAEPEGIADRRMNTVTRTIKVPLREADAPIQSEPRVSQAPNTRPRAGSKSKGRRKSATPTTERRRRHSVTDLDIVVLGDDADEDEWARKPKKSSPRKTKVKKCSTEQEDDQTVEKSAPGFEVRQDVDVEDEEQATIRDDSPELRQLDLNRVSFRTRSNSIKQNVRFESEEMEERSGVPFLKALPKTLAGRRTVSANSAMTYPTPSPTVSERGRSVEAEDPAEAVTDHLEEFDTIMESEGFTMIDLDSIPSVKQILSSPLDGPAAPSSSPTESRTDSESTVRRNVITSPDRDQNRLPKPLRPIPPYLVLPDGESEISSTLPSSPPAFENGPQLTRQKTPLSYLQVPLQPRNRQVTPQPYSSPKLPSPPKQPTSKERSTPDSAKVMRAGLALQSAMDPAIPQAILPARAKLSQNQPVSHARSSSEELFEGFDSSTQRELRAGLRFGEELAKKQSLQGPIRVSTILQNTQPPTQVWRGESVLSRTPTQTELTRSQEKSMATELRSRPAPTQLSTAAPLSKHNQQHPDRQAVREHQWQLERESVSKQIQEASPDKVVVIESDDETDHGFSGLQSQEKSMLDVTMDDDDDDIWLEEAKDSSSSPRQEQEVSVVEDEDEGAAKDIGRSSTSLMTSSHKHEKILDQANTSTMITNGDDVSGLFWHQRDESSPGFGTAAISNVRRELRKSGGAAFATRRTSGSFDIEKMLGTPKRIKESLEKKHGQQSASSNTQDVESETLNRLISKPNANEIFEDDVSYESEYSNEPSVLDTQPVQMIPVDFDDSTISDLSSTPPQPTRARVSLSPSAARPPTPKSALKGTRQSFGLVSERPDLTERRVIFAERSRGVNVDWVENSSSLLSTANDFTSSPIVQHQKHHGERQVVAIPTPRVGQQPQPVTISAGQTFDHQQVRNEPETQKGWLGWLWKQKASESNDERAPVISTIQVDGSSDRMQTEAQNETQDVSRTTASQQLSLLPYANAQTSRSVKQPVALSPTQPQPCLPSYLLAPSYPSDPTRPTDNALFLSGRFTNTHFRTLHILHRKSQRQRFHAPKFSTCRPEIRHLVATRWKLQVDESDAGLGGFAWTVGQTEARVLERFCREIEFDNLRQGLDERECNALSGEWCGNGGIWGGLLGHGQAGLQWGWSVEQLASWLGRVVVGEVVRQEEFGGPKYMP